ncbi:MAG TPA: non-heme iron oxygenase ferredoxin subunit [Actinomycetota bacterium]|nr:non-heme iron oxygenase ferredoxin subunit [Actinomycetota bacterium]
MADWVRVAGEGDVKEDDMIQVMVDGEPVLLGNVEGELLAISDICSHEYVELHDGWLEDGEVECPMHGSKFSLRTGAVRGLPATRPVPAYEVKVEGGDVYVRGPR